MTEFQQLKASSNVVVLNPAEFESKVMEAFEQKICHDLKQVDGVLVRCLDMDGNVYVEDRGHKATEKVIKELIEAVKSQSN